MPKYNCKVIDRRLTHEPTPSDIEKGETPPFIITVEAATGKRVYQVVTKQAFLVGQKLKLFSRNGLLSLAER